MTKIDDLESFFNNALSRYQSGEDILEVIDDFKQITNEIPNHFAAWTCLSWLYLILKKNDDGLFAAKQAVRLNSQDPQARMNLALALLAHKKQRSKRSHHDNKKTDANAP